MRKMLNGICVAMGFISLGIGAAGIVLPVLPTTPFLLLAAGLFARGSKRFHNWLISSKLYKRYIEQTFKKKEMTKRAKGSVLVTITCLLLTGFILAPIWHARVVIAAVLTFHYYYFLFRIKTVAQSPGNTVKNRLEQEKYDGC